MEEHLKRSIIIDGLLPRIEVITREKERHTAFGSTDRKGYTVLVKATLYGSDVYACTDIQPFMNTEQQRSAIDRLEQEVKYTLAEKIYYSNFLSNQQSK